MILSVYSAAASQDDSKGAGSEQEHKQALLLPLEGNARLDNQIYVAQGKLIQSEKELSKLMASVHNTLLRYFKRQSYVLVPHDHQPVPAGDTGADVDAVFTQVQARLLAASENKLHVATSATVQQRKLAHGTYTFYLRSLVATWHCIMSVARQAKREMLAVDEEQFMQDVLHMPPTSNVASSTAATLHTYHARVQQCADRVEQLRQAAMRQLWTPHAGASIPLDLHVNMFKNYLSQVRAWLQQQPDLALP